MLDEISFGYLLSPSTLEADLHKLSKDEIGALLKTFLLVFQSEQAKNHSHSAESNGGGGGGDSDVLVINEAESGNHEPSSAVSDKERNGEDPAERGRNKKQVVLQMLILQLASALRWQLKEIDEAVNLAMQHTLLDILLQSTGKATRGLTIEGSLKPDKVEEVLKGDSVDKCFLFALTLFYRWALRSMAQLPTPIPAMNKVQIYAGLSKHSFPTHMVGTDQNLGLHISTHIPVAIKVSQVVLEWTKKDPGLLLAAQPSVSAFKINKYDGLTFSSDDEDWKSEAKGRSTANINYDLACYHLCFEDYAEAAKCLAAIRGTPNAVLETCDINIEALGGMFRTIWGEESSTGSAKAARDSAAATVPAFTSPTKGDGEQIVKIMRKDPFSCSPGMPFYWRVNYELNAWNYGFETAAEMSKLNLGSRISQGHAANLETYNAPSLIQPLVRGRDNRKAAMFNSIKTLSVPADYKTKPSLSCKMYESKQKVKKLRAKTTNNAFFRELRPEKVLKMTYELSKTDSVVRRLSSKWTLDDPFAANYMANFGRAGSADNDFAFVLLVKIRQLIRVGGSKEAKLLYQALEEAEKERTQQNSMPSALMRNLQVQCLAQELNTYLHRKSLVPDGLSQKCRRAVMDIRPIYSDLHADILESCIIALVNKSDWEFVMSMAGGPNLPMEVQVSQLLLSIVICTKGGAGKNFDLKKSVNLLVDHLTTTVRQGSNKREAAGKPPKKPWFHSYLSKLHHPDVLVVLASVVAALYNHCVDDSALKINHEFPVLQMATPNFQIGPEHFLKVLNQLVARSNPLDPFWTKFQGELHFSAMNYPAALRCYIQTMALGSNFFLKLPPFSPDQEDKTMAKVIKCLTEMGCNSYAVLFCQCLSGEVDYSTAFKCLEDRSTGDAMDGIYDNLWDVTVLEYAVSMHTRRGDQSRKKLALEKVGSLEVNTNNNPEIQAENSASKRSKFLRVMCRHFL